MAANMEAPDDDTGFQNVDDEPLEAYRFRFPRDERGMPDFNKGTMWVKWRGFPDPKHDTKEVIMEWLVKGGVTSTILRIWG